MSGINMNEYFRNIANGHNLINGCALLVRDAWIRLYNLTDLPKHADQSVTIQKAGKIMDDYKGLLVEQINQPDHGCMVTTRQGNR